jgi:hypothetical protein
MSDLSTIFPQFGRLGPATAPFLPDLTLWYRWHRQRGTLPQAWRDLSLVEVAQALGVTGWVVEHPWRLEHAGITVTTTTDAGRRVIRYETPDGVLTAQWSLGPDGDWWQTEYPVKTVEDLPAAHAVVAARRYVLDGDSPSHAMQSSAAIVGIELPMRPYSDILHTLLGWGEGLMLLKGEGAPIVAEMLAMLEEKLRELAAKLANLPGDVLYAPDNLDGQYISPRSFREHMTASYRHSAEAAHAHSKRLVVHAGGPVRRLLPLLAEAGVDVVEGVAPPPQADASLVEARAAAGSDLVLWGGIAQDYLLPGREQAEFEAVVSEATRQASQDGRVILGVADRVPADADLDRLRALPALIAAASAA